MKNGCMNRPDQTEATSYPAQDGWIYSEDGTTRTPNIVQVKHAMTRECVYSRSVVGTACDGCPSKREAVAKPAIVEAVTVKVYMAPTAGRRYFSLSAACNAEARAIIQKKWPAEKPEYEDGMRTYPGFHWRDLPRSEVLHRRMVRLIRATEKKMREAV